MCSLRRLNKASNYALEGVDKQYLQATSVPLTQRTSKDD